MAPNKEKRSIGDDSFLLIEWNWEKNLNLSPYAISYGSAKKVWWLCSVCGNEWETPAYSRGSNGCGCPMCARIKRGQTKKLSSAKKNSFVKRFHKIAKEWHYEKNSKIDIASVSAYSNITVWWICSDCGYEWETSVCHRTKEGNSCPVCSRQRGALQKTKTHAKRNNLILHRPDIAKEWHPSKNGELLADDVSVKSNKKVWWKCSYCEFEWQDTVKHRSEGRGCPKCSMAQTSFAEQLVYYYVAEAFPDAINRYKEDFEFDIYIPSQRIAIEYDGYFYHQSEQSLYRDNKKDEYCHQKNIKLIRFRSSRLPDTILATRITCEDHRIQGGIEELLAILPETEPIDVNVERDSQKIRAQFRNMESNRSLATKKPHLLSEWHPSKNQGLSPDSIYAYSNIKVWWQCSTCGYEWKTTANHRSNGQGCPRCAGKIKAEA